ncbi:MAG: hypothetical protein IPJ88_01315 [Myxococcales bacterium]|nr:MAG: hypothetical protein IPJ88_01315 [Myxococcales bacterium]
MRSIGVLLLLVLGACQDDPVGTQFQVFNNTGAVIAFDGLGSLQAVGQSFAYERPCDVAECGYPQSECPTVPYASTDAAINDGESITFDWDGNKWEFADQATCALPAQPNGLIEWVLSSL